MIWHGRAMLRQFLKNFTKKTLLLSDSGLHSRGLRTRSIPHFAKPELRLACQRSLRNGSALRHNTLFFLRSTALRHPYCLC